ncbi:MAG: FxDxF family PEP-CTERM protein [Pseudomonadota bacterium]
MKMKALTAVACLLVSMSSAMATTVDLTKGQDGIYTGYFGATHTSGAFTDVYEFSPFLTYGKFDTILSSIGTSAASNIDFTFADFNGHSLTLNSSGPLETAYLGLTSFNGPLTLTVSGLSGATASYSGSLNVVPVPEPESYALMLGGLALLGVVARRRKSA